ncbi:NAD(P)/FAD-dependent oxidoreductase [Cryobacterium algoricola]|uniref:NAD(P)/FAD-dependent oxidoreductase n=1 Tax=Cryobacterium algoricola TaxID=1259183 RepID=A0ABY2IEH2_9MICO|nr:NAD(P)/FAD-dependent oxidoreductase [Cryobacterium algoricola]TFB87266.1 NAD(P)/FAD-dependent oxidoreductase [Cryobacterium algoricola]
MSTAIVVGAGPNGLTAAAVLAVKGMKVTVIEGAEIIGGGTRTSELVTSGVWHDECSAVHPMAAASPAFRLLGLERHGLTWAYPDIDVSHPLDGGNGAALHRSIEETAANLGVDGKRWRSDFGPLSDRIDQVLSEFLQPLLHIPQHPIDLALFGMRALPPATWTAHRWKGEGTRALFAGISAHSMYPLGSPTTSAIGTMMIAIGHQYGWPIAVGGSRSITDALAGIVLEHGGKIETGRTVVSLKELPRADIVMLDLTPQAVARLAGNMLPRRVAKSYGRWKYGPAAFKLDLVVEEGIPWLNAESRSAGTVHLGGTLDEIVQTELDVSRGIMPEKPFVLVGQQYLADSSRSNGNQHPIWAYAHVPHGFSGDATSGILNQLERFAPGVRERIVGMATRSPRDFEIHNPNYVGGNIVSGANSPIQVLFRPSLGLNPYATGIPGVFICSAATPPGGGVHGMGGFNAAETAFRSLVR